MAAAVISFARVRIGAEVSATAFSSNGCVAIDALRRPKTTQFPVPGKGIQASRQRMESSQLLT